MAADGACQVLVSTVMPDLVLDSATDVVVSHPEGSPVRNNISETLGTYTASDLELQRSNTLLLTDSHDWQLNTRQPPKQKDIYTIDNSIIQIEEVMYEELVEDALEPEFRSETLSQSGGKLAFDRLESVRSLEFDTADTCSVAQLMGRGESTSHQLLVTSGANTDYISADGGIGLTDYFSADFCSAVVSLHEPSQINNGAVDQATVDTSYSIHSDASMTLTTNVNHHHEDYIQFHNCKLLPNPHSSVVPSSVKYVIIIIIIICCVLSTAVYVLLQSIGSKILF